jgi:hypothetical protein
MTVNIQPIKDKVLQVFEVNDALTTTELIDIVKIQLYLSAVKGLIQSRRNALARHLNGAMKQYCINHDLPEDTTVNDPEVYMAVYLAENPDTTLDGEELEQAAAGAFWTEMDSIDTASGGIYAPLIEATLSAEFTKVNQIQEYVSQKEYGVEVSVDNLLKSAVHLDWK